jgi:hypothetical protein
LVAPIGRDGDTARRVVNAFALNCKTRATTPFHKSQREAHHFETEFARKS